MNSVLKEEPGNALTLYNRALIKAKIEDWSGSLADLDRVIDINPENVLALFNRAAIFLEMERYRDAIADYTRAIELYPDFAKAYMNRSYAKNKLGQYKSAREDYVTANKKVQEYMAKNASSENGVFSDTTKQYDNLIALDADFAKKDFNNELLQHREVNIKLKSLYKFVPTQQSISFMVDTERFKFPKLDSFIDSLPINMEFSAVKDFYSSFDEIKTVNSSVMEERDTYNLFAKAIVETSNRQFNTALVCYNEAIEKDSDNPFLYINRSALNADMIDFVSSMDNSVQVLSLEHTNTTKTVVRESVERNYDYSVAINDLKRAQELYPDFPYIYYNMANLYCLSSDLTSAITNYNKALELYSNIPEAYYNRGLVLIYLKDKEKGCIDLSKAGELGVSDAYSVIKKYCKNDELD